MTVPDFVTIPARLGREANLADNDVWPGDKVDVLRSSLAQEAANVAARRLQRLLEQEIRKAFAEGKDYVVAGYTPAARDGFTLSAGFRGRPAEPGEFAEGLPVGWTLYSVEQWERGEWK